MSLDYNVLFNRLNRNMSRFVLRLTVAIAASLLAAGPSAAQLPTPGGVVGGTVGQVGQIGNQTIGNTQGALGGLQQQAQDSIDTLRSARVDALNALRRAHPDVIDTDRNGAP